MKIGDFQSLLQFFAAIYLVVEWVSPDRILAHYKKVHLDELKYRILRVKRYSEDLEGIWADYTIEDSTLIGSYDLNSSYVFFRKICLIYFIACFVGLVIAAFFGDFQVNVYVLLSVLIVLCIPFLYVLKKLIMPVKTSFESNKRLIEEFLLPLEIATEDFRKQNSYPNRMDAVKKRRGGDMNALNEHRAKLKQYNESYDAHMKNSL